MFRAAIFMLFTFSGVNTFAGAMPSPEKLCFDACIGESPNNVNACLDKCYGENHIYRNDSSGIFIVEARGKCSFVFDPDCQRLVENLKTQNYSVAQSECRRSRVHQLSDFVMRHRVTMRDDNSEVLWISVKYQCGL
ncbi:MAG: hypothetical protein AB7K68_16280 [Bacteriovoracia bacterium]